MRFYNRHKPTKTRLTEEKTIRPREIVRIRYIFFYFNDEDLIQVAIGIRF